MLRRGRNQAPQQLLQPDRPHKGCSLVTRISGVTAFAMSLAHGCTDTGVSVASRATYVCVALGHPSILCSRVRCELGEALMCLLGDAAVAWARAQVEQLAQQGPVYSYACRVFKAAAASQGSPSCVGGAPP